MVRQKEKNIAKNKSAASFSSVYSDFSIHSASNAELPLWRSLAETLFQNSSIELETNDILLLAVSSAREPIGFVHLRPRPSFVLLAGIGVIQPWQGRGVGRALMDAAIQKAQEEWPALALQLEVEQANPAALRLYASWGFVLKRISPGAYSLCRSVSN